jgi:peptide chain release factor
MFDVTLFLTSGNGPVECRIALARLLDILVQAATAGGCTVDIASGPQPDDHGPKSAVVTISGAQAASLAAEYCGTIRFVFKSPVRKGHQRQNWFVGVQQLDFGAQDQMATSIDVKDLRFETLRAGGPGGQHQNTTDSAVRAIHIPTGITTVCRDERSQHRNKAAAIRKLQAMLELLAVKREDEEKTSLFLASKDLERGNATRTFRL